MFKERTYSKELIDDFTIQGRELYRALDELIIINRYLGGYAVTNSALCKALEKIIPGSRPLIVLDVGAGSGSFPGSLSGHKIEYIRADINPGACLYMRKSNIDSKVVCCNAFRLPFNHNNFDFIHVALFLHHFTKDEVIFLLQEFNKISRYGIIINDLRRSVWAYWGIKILTFLFSGSKMVRHDGPLSVKRAFTRQELDEIISIAGISSFEIKRKWAFRWRIILWKN